MTRDIELVDRAEQPHPERGLDLGALADLAVGTEAGVHTWSGIRLTASTMVSVRVNASQYWPWRAVQ
ncbi:hypothetical protein [Nocardia pseudovaccinii]|uniref:hypothetical protein n=1 Tax=Nocardia pseudovaccinii TaxID=189540 RepID=UPI0007A4358F|nr:hypothetical protein [Nocardia pseudovaccinii]